MTGISNFFVLVNSFSFVTQELILAVVNTCVREHDIPTLSILFSSQGRKALPVKENLSLYSVVHS